MTTVALHEPDLATLIRAYHDVTERLKSSHELLQREVARLRDELSEKNRELARRERLAALGEMAAGVAHEIRNPLGGIGLYASLLERDLGDRPAQFDIARRIGEGVRKMDRIVGDVLAYAGNARPHLRSCPLSDILNAVLEQAHAKVDLMGAHLEVAADLYDMALRCDPAQIERALVNLVINALDAAGSGGRVWIRRHPPQQAEGFFGIAVEDNGPGIPRESLHRVFDPFFTTKDNGTGLGLAIVHRIVEAHGGTIRAGTREGGGAAFVLQLPAAHGAEADVKTGGIC